ncbi:hypothetical protein [Mycolicibacter minnesotensis]
MTGSTAVLRCSCLLAAVSLVASGCLSANRCADPSAVDAPTAVDFKAYPQANAEDYSLGTWRGYGFTTPRGFRCKLASHMSMSAIDCDGPFAATTGEANTVHLFAYSPGNGASPVQFSRREAKQPGLDFGGIEPKPLPVNTTLAALNGRCVWTEEIELACLLGSSDQGRGFIATPTSTSIWGPPFK